MKHLKEDIKNKSFKNVYLFYGDEYYYKSYYENLLKKELLPSGSEMMNLDIYSGKNVMAQTVIDACDTLPFMNEYRLIIVKDSELFAAGRKDETEKLANYMENIASSCILVFIEEKLDKRNKLYRAVSKKGACVEFKNPSEQELIDFVIKQVEKKNKNITMQTAIYFVRTVFNSMETIILELQKLLDYKSGDNEINITDIDNICTKSLEAKIFELVADIGNKRLGEALEAYNGMLRGKESPIMILAMIERQFRLILQTKYLAEKGMGKDEIANKLGIRGFVVSECMKQSRNFKKKVLLEAIKDCLECDINIKTGKIIDKNGVEIIIIKYGSIL